MLTSKMLLRQLLFSLVTGCLLIPGLVQACRYNIRDIGFIDQETEGYHVYGVIDRSTPQDVVSQLTSVADRTFKECNIQFELLNIDTAAEHPVLKRLPPTSNLTFPAGMMASPDGHVLSFSFATRGQVTSNSLFSAMERLVISPKREEIASKVINNFAVVLLIEGKSGEENQTARKTITQAIDQIELQLKSMPKKIARPPAMVVLENQSLLQEEILLWSLGIGADAVEQAIAVIIYGRIRWMGPLIKGAEITAANLTGLLSIIGADCECGMDLSWTRGTRLPMRWNRERQKEIAKILGFDPENPLVKVEVGRILSRQGAISPEDSNSKKDSKVSLNSSGLPQSQFVTNRSVTVSSNQSLKVQNSGEDNEMIQRFLLSIGAISAILISTGLWIYFRKIRSQY